MSETHEAEAPSDHDPFPVALNAIQTIVTIENAPYLDVMLLNSRIHHEYREICLQKLSAIVSCQDTYRLCEKSYAFDPLPPKLQRCPSARQDRHNLAL